MTGPLPINTGVCEPWTTGEDVAACCTATVGSDLFLFDQAALLASDLLYELSGHNYPGLCEALVRPGGNDTCWTPLRWGWGWNAGRRSQIRLAGYPVREILEVQIDGAILDPADYELQRNRFLVRLDGLRWPTRPPGGDSTFTLDYTYGVAPPLAGVLAAIELACELLRAGCGGSAGDCELPAGTVRVTRQGIQIDTASLGLWLLGTQRTGLPMTDAFLSVYGRLIRRRTTLYTPELDPFPLRIE